MARSFNRAVWDDDVTRPAGLGHGDLVLDLPVLDALHAVGALLHHTAHPDGDFGILHHFDQLRHPLRSELTEVKAVKLAQIEVEEIKTANLVGAIVRAVTRADATVVSHRIEAFFVVHGGIDGADDFARCEFALRTGDRLEGDLRILGDLAIAFTTEGTAFGLAVGIVAVETNPMHLTSPHHLVLAHDRNVILSLTGHHAGVATDASVEIDRHAPLVVSVELWRRVHRAAARDLLRTGRVQLGAILARELVIVRRGILCAVNRR